MANVGLPPTEYHLQDRGTFLTLIFPGDCNLKCPFCVIKQRDELLNVCLSASDFLEFIFSASKSRSLFAIGIQGYEPLLPSAHVYTETTLKAAFDLGVPATLVTNGSFLVPNVPMLSRWRPAKIGVSIDSPIPEVHDRIRGAMGSWKSAVEGIRAAKKNLWDSTKIAITSVLLPSDRGRLQIMPPVIRDLGVDEWIVTPVQRIGTRTPGGPVGKHSRLYEDLVLLRDAADDAGITLIVDDELNTLTNREDGVNNLNWGQLPIRSIPPSIVVARLTAAGYFSVGRDILSKVTSETTHWNPGAVDARSFLEVTLPKH